MSTNITIWTLNKAADLVSGKENKIISLFQRKGFFCTNKKAMTCAFGDRNIHILSDRSTIAHSLTYEQDAPDEYFVPISLKCIGSKYKQVNELDEQGKRLLSRIINRFKYFQDHTYFQSFWDKGYGPLNKVRMNTINYSGYYEILEKTKPNILIGYSQGGLISRYLAFLDEYVFKQNVISAIITIAAPNYGSPLANPMNKENVTDGINTLLITLLSMNPTRYPNLKKFVDSKLDFDDITDLIDKMLSDFSKDEISEKSEESLSNTLASANKWLSGLRDDPNSAFHDLSIMNFKDEYSVLNLVNKYPLKKIYYGSIIGTNNDLDDLIKSLAGNVLGRLGWYFIKRKKILNNKIADNIKSINDVYKFEIINENDNVKATANEQIKSIIQNYEQGIPSLKIKPRAHDFIVTSTSQMLPDSNDGRLIKNIINKYAGHNSGKSRKYKAGKKNYKHIYYLLKEIKKRIVNLNY